MIVSSRISRLAQSILRSRLVRPRTQEDRNERLLYISTALVGVPIGGIMAFLPVFMARLGASSTLIGWLTSAPALLAIFTLIPSAMIAERNTDQVRVRVRYARMMRIAFLICALLPFFIPPQYLPIALIIIWTAKTFPDTVATTAWTTVMTEAVSPQRRAKLNGTRWALLSIVSAISSAFFGWMLDRLSFPLNYQMVFMISFIFDWMDPYFFQQILVPPLDVSAVVYSSNLIERIRQYFEPIGKEKSFLLFLACTILYRIALNLPAPLFSLFWVNNLQAPDTLIGLRGTIGYVALVAGYLFWGRSANRMGHRKVLMLAALGLAVYPIATALAPSAIWIIPIAGIWGLTASGIDVGLFDLMLASIPKQRQPLFAAVWSMVANLAIFAGPLLGAALSQATSLAAALIIAGVVQAITTIPFIFLPDDV
ncbi:MAG: MFS transporter [Anaerolineae bacterium]|jgi:MFS family permease